MDCSHWPLLSGQAYTLGGGLFLGLAGPQEKRIWQVRDSLSESSDFTLE